MGCIFSSPNPYQLLNVSSSTSIKEIQKKYKEFLENYKENRISKKQMQKISVAYFRILEDTPIPSINSLSDFFKEKNRKIIGENTNMLQNFYDKIFIREELDPVDIRSPDFYSKVYKMKIKDEDFQEKLIGFTRILQNMDIQNNLVLPNVTIYNKKKESTRFWCKKCNKSFKNQNKLNLHDEKKHSDNKNDRSTQILNLSFSENNPNALKRWRRNENIYNDRETNFSKINDFYDDSIPNIRTIPGKYSIRKLIKSDRISSNVVDRVPKKDDEKNDVFIENEDSLIENKEIIAGNEKRDSLTENEKKNSLTENCVDNKKVNKKYKKNKNSKRKEGKKKKQKNENRDNLMFLICGYCKRSFENRNELMIHIRNNHSN